MYPRQEKIVLQPSPQGLTFVGALALVFITLKLCGVIHWSWWWVLTPFWVPAVIALLIVLGTLVAALGKACFDHWRYLQRKKRYPRA